MLTCAASSVHANTRENATKTIKNFILIGAAGYIAPRHMAAIKATGNRIIAAFDPHDSVGILDSYFPDADFFTEFERLDRHLDKLQRKGVSLDYFSVCSPNYLHDAHCRFGLRYGADVICEKPIVLNPRNLIGLQEIEAQSTGSIFSILQLRLHPAIIALKKKVDAAPAGTRFQVNLKYITARGKWYQFSWKGDQTKSGGIATNIGIHFFDMLIWIFGGVQNYELTTNTATKAEGTLKLEKADVEWLLSIDQQDLPKGDKRYYRHLLIDGEDLEFSDGFTDLHEQSYAAILSGNGFTLRDSFPSIELAQRLRNV